MTTFPTRLRVLRGERVLAVSPTLAPEVLTATWRRRPQLFAGRALTPQALATDQAERSGRLATAGQALAPGVVGGLDVKLEQSEGATLLSVSAGLGHTASGEDVRVTRPLRVALDELVVWLPDGDQTLATLRASAGTSPLALVLLLEPIVIGRADALDARDPCELDAGDFAFEDAQWLDGVRLVATPLPFPLPPAGARFRNELAYGIFEREAALAPGELLPWEGTGLAIALLGFPSAALDPFIDANVVSRGGGQASARRGLLPGVGGRRLWQARFRQFMEELAELDIAPLAAAGLSSRFRHLPPVGTLPAGALDVRGDRGEPHLPLPESPLFPRSFVLESVPVELESLDDLLAGGASLAPLDLEAREQVQVLVPLPQQYFDPDVLLVEDETPDEFRAAIRLFLLRLNHRLGRRLFLRDDETDLSRALFGATPEHPEVDRDAVLGEVRESFPRDEDLPEDERPAPETAFGDDTRDELLSLVLRMAQIVGTTPLAVLHAQLIAEHDNAPPSPPGTPSPEGLAEAFLQSRFGGAGVSGFVERVSRKLIEASERLDVAYLRVKSELYRVRAHLADESAATQLATSPALAAIAPRPSGEATPVKLEAFKRFLITGERPNLPEVRPSPSVDPQVLSEGTPGADGVPAAILFGSDVLQRLRSSLVANSKESTARAKRLVLRKLLEIHDSGLSLAGLRFPGLRVPTEAPDDAETPWPPGTPPSPDSPMSYRLVRIEWVAFLLADFDTTGIWRHDPILEDPAAPGGEADEATLFATAIRSVEHGIAALRLAEGRLAGFERALDQARLRLQADLSSWEQLQTRLLELDEQISEYRHDVRVARALEQDEIARARRVNEERRQLLAEHVPFLVFRRPRSVQASLAAPGHPLSPARESDPLPTALAGDFEAPPQLRVTVDLLRDAPLQWLSFAEELLRGIKQRGALRQVVHVAHARAGQALPQRYEPFDNGAFQDETGEEIREIFRSQRASIERLTQARARLDVNHYLRFSWFGLIPELSGLATLNDVALGGHGRQEVAAQAMARLEDVYRVAAALYDGARQLPAFVRLQWLEALSEASSSVDLRELSVLPDWATLEVRDRRRAQARVDWLYQQVRTSDAAALRFMHDLIRIALLLATHPPVSQILQAEVRAAQAVSVGGRADLSFDSTRARIGMHVLLYESQAAAAPAARAVIEDLGDAVASVRVIGSDGERSVVPVRAEIVEPDQSARAAVAGGSERAIGRDTEIAAR